jgi:hypothetical protein
VSEICKVSIVTFQPIDAIMFKCIRGLVRVSDKVPCRVGRSTGCVSSSVPRNVGYFSNKWAIKFRRNPFLVVISGRFIPY